MGNTTAIGTGQASVQFFERTISKSKLAQMQEESDRRWEQARIEAEEQRRLNAIADREREERRERERAEREARLSQRSSGQQPAAPTSNTFSMSLKSECSRTLKIFIGSKPRFGSGTTRSISSNSINSFSGFAGQTYWILDESGNGVSSYTVSAGRHNMRILPSCSGFAPR